MYLINASIPLFFYVHFGILKKAFKKKMLDVHKFRNSENVH